MNKNQYTLLDSAAGLYIPEDLDLFPQVRARLTQRKTFMQTLRARPALAVMLVLLALILLTGVAYAISRSLGYIPGVGIVEPSTALRVLAEPVSQTREGITVTIDKVVADSQRTVIIYRAEGLSLRASNSKGGGGYYRDFLRLPDGTILKELYNAGYNGTPEPIMDIPMWAEGGYPNYVRRLVYPAVNPQVDELTLVLPGLDNMPADTAPENWEIALPLKPAPADMTLIPILGVTSQATSATTDIPSLEATNAMTLHDITFSLDNVMEVEDGYIFTGSFSSASALTWVGGFPTLSDGSGQKIPRAEVPLSVPRGNHQWFWSVRTNRKAFQGQLVFSVPSVYIEYEAPAVEFELDLGTNPQIGQTWEIDREFSVDGYTLHLQSVQLIEPYLTCSQASLLFQFQPGADKIPLAWNGGNPVLVSDSKNPTPPILSQNCNDIPEGRENVQRVGVQNRMSYREIPTGLHHFSIVAKLAYPLDGPWRVTWNPPETSEPIPTPGPAACLTLEEWNRVVSRNDALPPGLSGRLLLHVDDPNPDARFSILQLVNLDGNNLQTFGNGGWSTLSPDGSRLVYQDTKGLLNYLDLSTGQSSILASNGYKPIVSPDNSRVMYTNTFHLYVINADGTGSQEIDTSPAASVSPVGWLPDNQTIIYSVSNGDGSDLKSYNLQSGEKRNLFTTCQLCFGSLSPDGQWIVFSEYEFGEKRQSRFIARIDGSERKPITTSEVFDAAGATWSPDGQWLLFGSFESTEIHVLVNPFTCQALHVNTIHGSVIDWAP